MTGLIPCRVFYHIEIHIEVGHWCWWKGGPKGYRHLVCQLFCSTFHYSHKLFSKSVQGSQGAKDLTEEPHLLTQILSRLLYSLQLAPRKGNEAFKNADWDLAIKEYNKAGTKHKACVLKYFKIAGNCFLALVKAISLDNKQPAYFSNRAACWSSKAGSRTQKDGILDVEDTAFRLVNQNRLRLA